jgi:large subunit ribosomal protein L15
MPNFLSTLPKITQKKKKRLGRGAGSGRGAKSGRGTTRHQKAREDIPLHFEGGQAKISKKYPLLRGKMRNKPVGPKPLLIGLDDLNVFSAGERVDVDALIKKGLIDARAKKIGVKLLANGKLEKKLNLKIPASKKAQKQVVKLGGKIENGKDKGKN